MAYKLSDNHLIDISGLYKIIKSFIINERTNKEEIINDDLICIGSFNHYKLKLKCGTNGFTGKCDHYISKIITTTPVSGSTALLVIMDNLRKQSGNLVHSNYTFICKKYGNNCRRIHCLYFLRRRTNYR